MIRYSKIIIALLVLSMLLLTSCQSSDTELIPPNEGDWKYLDKMIDQKLASEIKIALCRYKNNSSYSGKGTYEPSDIPISMCWGKYGDCYIVADGFGVNHISREETIAGYTLRFPSSKIVYAYYDGFIFRLKEAYANGLINKADVYEIGCKVSVVFAEEYPTP